ERAERHARDPPEVDVLAGREVDPAGEQEVLVVLDGEAVASRAQLLEVEAAVLAPRGTDVLLHSEVDVGQDARREEPGLVHELALDRAERLDLELDLGSGSDAFETHERPVRRRVELEAV